MKDYRLESTVEKVNTASARAHCSAYAASRAMWLQKAVLLPKRMIELNSYSEC